MSSETSMIAANFRLQEWAAQIRQCQSWPAGMSVASWCANNGITKANYYYRLRRVRKACLEHIQEEIPVQQIVPVVLLLRIRKKDSFLLEWNHQKNGRQRHGFGIYRRKTEQP